MEIRGIEPHTRIVAQGVTSYCDHIVTVISRCKMGNFTLSTLRYNYVTQVYINIARPATNIEEVF